VVSRRKTVVFRVDASYRIGTGHVMRCLALADGLKREGAEVAFICRQHEGHLFALIRERGFRVMVLPAPRASWAPSDSHPVHAAWLGSDWETDVQESARALGSLRPDWLVVDHYALDVRWEERLQPMTGRILVIDDLADRPHLCDALVDQNLVRHPHERYNRKVSDGATLMLGPSYALLQPEYLHLHENVTPRHGAVGRLLVSFGGVDRQGLTRRTVEALFGICDYEFEADIVLAADAPDFGAIQEMVSRRPGFWLHDRVPSLAPLMAAADLMVGAVGTTSWERLCLGLPAIVVTMADNQRPIAEELAGRNLVRWLGDAGAVTTAALRSALLVVFRTGLDADWSQRCLNVVDGRGVGRVCVVLTAGPDMPFAIREAEERDEAILLEWVNDPQTRRNAFNPELISPGEHRAWFQRRLGRPADYMLCIAESESGVPLGQVRFERHSDQWEISYAIAPAFRGLGLGRSMLGRAIAHLRRDRPGISLYGQVKPENMASRKIFEALKFSARTAGPDRYVFERSFRE
jgi:UDP-2,4-diacetamido-2,4,6-trideoxy-beta-L-altropyranose hydrolase